MSTQSKRQLGERPAVPGCWVKPSKYNEGGGACWGKWDGNQEAPVEAHFVGDVPKSSGCFWLTLQKLGAPTQENSHIVLHLVHTDGHLTQHQTQAEG